MKQFVFFCILFSTVLNAWATTTPKVPNAIYFADIKLVLDTEAQIKVQNHVNTLTEDLDNFSEIKNRCALYFPLIEKVFTEKSIPADFKYLAVQQSKLIANYSSNHQTIGYWQFNNMFAAKYGLRISTDVDERLHIMESTKGTATFLNESHALTQNWYYTLLSYHLGLSAVKQRFETTNVIQALNINGQTHDFILDFLAHKIAFKNTEKAPISLLDYPYGSGKSLEELAISFSFSQNDLKVFNQWLKSSQIPLDKNYSVIVPVPSHYAQEFAQNWRHENTSEETLIASSDVGPEDIIQFEKVASSPLQGDNPYPIISTSETKIINGEKVLVVTANGIPAFIAGARQNLDEKLANALGTTMKKVLKYNDMTLYDELQEGQVYYLKKKSSKGPIDFHTVIEEKNLWEVSQRYGIRLKNLAKFNRMEVGDPLQVGRVLWLKKKRPSKEPVEIKEIDPSLLPQDDTEDKITEVDTTPKEDEGKIIIGTTVPKEEKETTKIDNAAENLDPNAIRHTVKEGESLFIIANKYGVTAYDLKEWNNLDNRLTVNEGDILIVKRVSDIESSNNTTNIGKTETPTKEAETAGSRTGSVKAVKHTVKEGESLMNIAAAYNVSPLDINKWNSISGAVQPGQVLLIYASKQKEIDIVQNTGNGNQSQKLDTSNDPPVKDNEVYTPSENTTNTNTSNDVSGNDSPTIITTPSKESTTNTDVTTNRKQHTVVKGDTFWSISRKYGVSTKELEQWNNMKADQLKSGQVIYVSNGSSPSQDMASTSPTKQIKNTTNNTVTTNLGTHTVQKGETLYSISRMYSVPVKNLIAWNNLPNGGDSLNEGQQLKVSQSTSSSPSKTTSSSSSSLVEVHHKVEKGETLYSISRKYNVKVDDIKRLNNLENNQINSGQTLRIK